MTFYELAVVGVQAVAAMAPRAMTFYELTALTAGIFHLFLTFFVLSRDLRSSINRTYTIWGLSLTVWNLASYMKYQACIVGNTGTGLFWIEVLHLGVVFMPVSIFHLYMLIGGLNKPWLLRFMYGITGIFAVSIFTRFYIKDLRPRDFVDYGYVAEGGPMFYAFMVVYFSTGVITILMLYRQQRAMPPLHQARLRVLMAAYVILVVCGLHDLVPVLGVQVYPMTELKVHPIGNLAAIVFGLVMAYAVLQHQFLSIHVTLSRVAAQLVRILFVVLVGFAILGVCFLIIQYANRGEPDPNRIKYFLSALLALVAAASLTSILFPRLFGKGEESLERRILGDRFEYQDQVRGFIETIPFYGDSDSLLLDLNQTLASTIGVKGYQIILLDEIKHVFMLFRSHPPAPPRQIPGLTLDSPTFQFFRTSDAAYLAYKLAYTVPGQTEVERAARQALPEFDPEFCFPLVADGDPFGLLLVQEKTSGEPFTHQDLKLMVQMTRNLGLVLNQIRLKKQLLLAEEMELLGTMSRGIAHDLNNLLTPISTFLQLAGANENNRAVWEELLPTAMRNLETIRTYVRESLFFSKTQSLQLRMFRLDKAIQGGIDLARAALKEKEMTVAVQGPSEVEVEMDEVLIQRLLGNLLSNAIDASRPGSQIQISLDRLTKTQTECEWLRVRVIDQGVGISPENLKRVATPYFTTKDRGDHRRGFGLGLAICRKIVHLHGGYLSIISEEKVGTTVQVDLPDRQIAAKHARIPLRS